LVVVREVRAEGKELIDPDRDVLILRQLIQAACKAALHGELKTAWLIVNQRVHVREANGVAFTADLRRSKQIVDIRVVPRTSRGPVVAAVSRLHVGAVGARQ